jgi:hypothetical protein
VRYYCASRAAPLKRWSVGRLSDAVLMTRSRTSILLALGSAAFAIVGATPHVLFAFYGMRPFWSRFEATELARIVPHMPEAAMHSVPRAVVLLVMLWLVTGATITALLLTIPPIRRWSVLHQVALVLLFPAIVLPLLALVAPFEPGF